MTILPASDALAAAIGQAAAKSANGRAFLQTDMRAHMNPRRMEIIAGLAARLAQRLRRRGSHAPNRNRRPRPLPVLQFLIPEDP